jgi:hypothetical protein
LKKKFIPKSSKNFFINKKVPPKVKKFEKKIEYTTPQKTLNFHFFLMCFFVVFLGHPNKCPVMTCEMNFPSKVKLVQHLKIGKHGQPCPQCGKSFTKLDNLELHVRSHSTERPFQCDHCDKTYKDAPSLYSHMQSHRYGLIAQSAHATICYVSRNLSLRSSMYQ